jgi:methylenetetrahydrofolate dehydrogenase (NADP+)/methenyltetrahydrofolate cyclohydrolase
MTAQIIDGKAVAARVRTEVKERVTAFREKFGRAPGLDVVLVGDDAASAVYVRNKEKAAAEVGIVGRVHQRPATFSQAELLKLVAVLNAAEDVDGILVQMPLPKGLDSDAVIAAIDPGKDVDGLHPANAGLLVSGKPGLRPCTPIGSMRLLAEAGVDLAGAEAVVVGRSILVGKPIAALLLEKHATVTIAHSRTKNLAEVCRRADVLVAAVGKAGLVKGDWVKPGAAVIDVGINRGADGKLTGDVDFAAAAERAGWITPVPGGVGPMTIAMLLSNTVDAAVARESRR